MQLTITRPDDWHLHVRDGTALATVVPHSVGQFARAVIMPNLQPPVTDTAQALAYRERILAHVPPGSNFEPLMTLYLTDRTGAREIGAAKTSGKVIAGKLYPAGATTNSAAGVSKLENLYPALEAMQQHGLPLLVHGEVTDPEVDVFDREAVFIERVLAPLVERFATLKVVLEHITTRQAVEFVAAAPARVAATVTPQHLLYSRNALFRGGLRPHYYCLPVLKRERHRQALLAAVAGGSGKYFLGTDSAPHARDAKEAACGCAGCYTASHALALYAEAFEEADALDKLEGFASFYGADFYGLARNADSITLVREPQQIADSFAYGDGRLVPLRAGETLRWRLLEKEETTRPG